MVKYDVITVIISLAENLESPIIYSLVNHCCNKPLEIPNFMSYILFFLHYFLLS